MSKFPDNDGKEAIEMAELSAPSPAGGLYFDYDFDDYGEAVERKKGSRDGKNKMPWIKWRDHSTPHPSPPVEESNNEATIPKPIQRSFKPPTESQYDEGHYTISNDDELEASQVLPSVQQTNKRGVIWYVIAGTVVTALIGIAILLTMFLLPSNGQKASNDTSKSL